MDNGAKAGPLPASTSNYTTMTNELRIKLLENASAMLRHAEENLSNVALGFRYEYEHGFGGYRDYNISFSYNNTTKTAKIAINWYRGNEFVIEKGRIYDGQISTINMTDVTDKWLENGCGHYDSSIEKAIIITQNNWSNIKTAIQSHVAQHNNIFNFSV